MSRSRDCGVSARTQFRVRTRRPVQEQRPVVRPRERGRGLLEHADRFSVFGVLVGPPSRLPRRALGTLAAGELLIELGERLSSHARRRS